MTSTDHELRVAITGAGQGIGEATANRMAKSGAQLFLVDKNSDRLQQVAENLGPSVSGFLVADLSVAEQAGQVIPMATEALDGLTSVASLAGYAQRGTILDTKVDDWDAMQALNLRNHFQIIQAAAKFWVGSGQAGSIALAGSMNAHGGQGDLCAYSTAKGGLATLARHAAHALLPHQIRVNIVNFGWMRTQGEIDLHADLYGRAPQWLDEAAEELPFGRLIQPEEAAELLEYLLTARSSVMTGSVIDFDQSVPGSGPTTAVRNDLLTLNHDDV